MEIPIRPLAALQLEEVLSELLLKLKGKSVQRVVDVVTIIDHDYSNLFNVIIFYFSLPSIKFLIKDYEKLCVYFLHN